jgi:hypothetical protein
MVKKSRNSTKLGRREIISRDKLLERCKALKQFLEGEWGRIGLELQRVRKPEDVRNVLRLVPNIEWRRPFHEHPAMCLIVDGSEAVDRAHLARTHREYEKAEQDEQLRWSEYHSAQQQMRSAVEAVNSFIAYFQSAIILRPFFIIAFVVAQGLEVEQIRIKAGQTDESIHAAQKKKVELKEQLSRQDAWYARNETVKFAKNHRYEKTPLNFARAMAGLPDYGWLHSLRRCLALKDEFLSTQSFYYQLFLLIRNIVQRMKHVNLQKAEISLKKELLKEGSDPMLRAFVSPNWAYLQQAFAECRGKGFKRTELPYKIMGCYLTNVERPKGSAETELAKKNQLLPSEIQ